MLDINLIKSRLRVKRKQLLKKSFYEDVVFDKFFAWLSRKMPRALVYHCVSRALAFTSVQQSHSHLTINEISAVDVMCYKKEF